MASTSNNQVMTKKEYFKLMFDKLCLEHKGVKLNKVLCSQLMSKAEKDKHVFGSRRSMSRFFFSFDISELTNNDLKPFLITFGYYPSRNDHRELMQTVAKRIGNESTFIDTSQWSLHKLSFSISNVFLSIKTGLFQMKKTGLKFNERLQLSALICFYLNTIDALDKVNFSNVKKFLCLANCLDLENLLTQYLQGKHIKTFSLMDGAYYVHENDIPIMNIPFENLTSDIQLCWGQFSKDEFIKFGYPENRMKVIGYPKEVQGKLMKNNNPLKKCVVLLSYFVFERQNQDLINILYHFSDQIDFQLKLHPSLDYERYAIEAKEKGMSIIPKNITINDCVNNEKFDFAIAINSTTYYEALMRGLPCFRYYDGSYTRLAGYDDEFSNEYTLKSLINRFKNIKIEKYQEDIDKTLKYAIGWGIDNYQYFKNL